MVMTAGVGRNTMPKIFDGLSFEGKELNSSVSDDDGRAEDEDINHDGKTHMKNYNESLDISRHTLKFKARL